MLRPRFVVVLLASTCPAQGPADSSSPARPAAPRLPPLIEAYQADRGALQRRYPLALQPRRGERLRELAEQNLRALDELPFDRLGRDDQVDWLLLRNLLQHELAALGHDAARDAAAGVLLPFATALVELCADPGFADVVGKDAAASLDALAIAITKSRQRLEAGDHDRLPATVARRAAQRLEELRVALRRWFEFHDGYDPSFPWWVKLPYVEAEKALQQLATKTRERLVDAKSGGDASLVGEPIGRAALLDELRHAMIAYTPEELVEIAKQEMAWCDAQMLQASRELGFGEDWRQAQEHVKGLHEEPGHQPRLIRELAEEAIEFLETRELLTIPELCKETWRMAMMSPERQRVNPYFLGGEQIIVSFPTDTMSHQEKLMSLRSNNRHFARATVHHELIPGHHLQQFTQARHRSYRRAFDTPFWVEGWALYWEMRLWDLGFARGPEDRIGMLFWRKHRCARIEFSLSFHLGTMTAPQAVDFLVERVGHERSAAAAEVRRSVQGGYGPLYQAAYLLGGLQIRALQRELVGGGKLSERAFHDGVLRQNSVPIEMVRLALSGEDPTREHAPRWRFYDAAASGR